MNRSDDVEWWQIIIGVFLVLLPLVLMLDFWGDERLTADGKPIERDWFRQIEHEELEEAASHGEMIGVAGAPHAPDAQVAEDAPGAEDAQGARDAQGAEDASGARDTTPDSHTRAEGAEDDPADVASH